MELCIKNESNDTNQELISNLIELIGKINNIIFETYKLLNVSHEEQELLSKNKLDENIEKLEKIRQKLINDINLINLCLESIKKIQENNILEELKNKNFDISKEIMIGYLNCLSQIKQLEIQRMEDIKFIDIIDKNIKVLTFFLETTDIKRK